MDLGVDSARGVAGAESGLPLIAPLGSGLVALLGGMPRLHDSEDEAQVHGGGRSNLNLVLYACRCALDWSFGCKPHS